MLYGIAIVLIVGIIYAIAASMGLPTVKDGVVVLACWGVTVLVLTSAVGLSMWDELAARIPEDVADAALVIAVVSFAGAVVAAWQRFREQLKALKAKLPEPPKTSFKRVVARGPARPPR